MAYTFYNNAPSVILPQHLSFHDASGVGICEEFSVSSRRQNDARTLLASDLIRSGKEKGLHHWS